MTPTVVTPPPAAAPPAAVEPPVAAPPPADVAALQREIAQLKSSHAESQRTAEYWHEQAQAKAPKAAKEEEPDIDILELATKGGKEFDKYLTGWAKKNGYVRGDQMTTAIEEKAKQLTQEATLIGKYPDLEKHDSEMFKLTAQFYGPLKKDGVSESVAMTIAAERAELQLLREGKIKTPAEEKAVKETARLARIAAQGGDRGNRTPQEEEADTDLTVDQKRIAHAMLVGEPDKDGKPMDAAAAEAAYKARASKGVQRFGGKA